MGSGGRAQVDAGTSLPKAAATFLLGALVADMAGSRSGDEVVQLYIHDPVASISQPVRRLRDFQRATLDPGQTKSVKFTIDSTDVGIYDNLGRFVVEPGTIYL